MQCNNIAAGRVRWTSITALAGIKLRAATLYQKLQNESTHELAPSGNNCLLQETSMNAVAPSMR